MDLIFPHHENEIAQSEAAWGEPFARIWMHAGFLERRRREDEQVARQLRHHRAGPRAQRRARRCATSCSAPTTAGRSSFDVEKLADGRVVFPGVDEAERRVEYLYATREALVAAAAGAEPAGGEGPAGAGEG